MSIFDWENEGGMFIDPDTLRDDKPCDAYWGNVCSGFGGKTICTKCGWDMYDHPSEAWWLNEDGTVKPDDGRPT